MGQLFLLPPHPSCAQGCSLCTTRCSQHQPRPLWEPILSAVAQQPASALCGQGLTTRWGKAQAGDPPHRSLGYEKTCPCCSASPGSVPCGEAEPATGAGGRQPGERRETETPPRVRECSSFCLHFPAKTVTKSPPQPQLCAGGAAGARVRKREVREKPSSLPSGGVRGGSGEPSPLLRGKESQTPPSPSREGSGALPPAHQLWGVFWGEWGLPVGRAPAWSAPCRPASTYPFQDDLLVFKHPIAAVHLGRGKERVRAPHASRGTGIWRIHPKTRAVTADNLKCSCASLPWN